MDTESRPYDTGQQENFLLTLPLAEQLAFIEQIFTLPPPKRTLPRRELLPIDLKKFLPEEYRKLAAVASSLAMLLYHHRGDPKVEELKPPLLEKLKQLDRSLLYTLTPLFELYLLVLPEREKILTEQLNRLFFLHRDKKLWFKQGVSLFSHLMEAEEIPKEHLQSLEEFAFSNNLPPAKVLFALAGLTEKLSRSKEWLEENIPEMLLSAVLSKLWLQYQREIADWVYPLTYTLELALSSLKRAEPLFRSNLKKLFKQLEKFPWDKTSPHLLQPSIRSLRAFSEPFQCWELLEPIFAKIKKNPSSEELDSFYLWYSELLFKQERRELAREFLNKVRDTSQFTVPEKLTASFLSVNLENWELFQTAIEELKEYRVPYLFYLSLAAVKNGKNLRAIELLETLLKEYPEEHQARTLYWAILEVEELREKLLKDCENFSEELSHPLSPLANTLIATQLAISGRVEEAKSYFERVSPQFISQQSSPFDFSNIKFRYYASFALCCEELGEQERALELYRQAFEIEPYEWLGLRILSLLTSLERREEADQLYSRLKELYPDNQLLKFYGLVQADRSGSTEEMSQILEEFSRQWFEENNISEVWYYFQLKIFILKGQLERAVKFSLENLENISTSAILRELFSALIDSLLEENRELKSKLEKKSKQLKKYSRKNQSLLEKLENLNREKSLIQLMESNSQVVQRELSSFKPALPFGERGASGRGESLEQKIEGWIREREDLFSSVLSEDSRELIISAQALFLEYREREGVRDWGPPVIQLARALEKELNRGFADHFGRFVQSKEGEIPDEGCLSPLRPEKNILSLGELAYLLYHTIEIPEDDGSITVEKNRYSGERHRRLLQEFWETPPASDAPPELREFFTSQLPRILRKVGAIRNRASHGQGEFLSRREAEEFFSAVLGSAPGEGVLAKILELKKVLGGKDGNGPIRRANAGRNYKPHKRLPNNR